MDASPSIATARPSGAPAAVVVSSPATFFHKFVFPIGWGAFFSWGTAALFLHRGGAPGHAAPPSWARWLCLGALLLGGLVFRQVSLPLKRVAFDDGFLRISNYLREIRVPFAEVRAGGFGGGEIDGRSLVVLEFDRETPFGESVQFLPKSREAVELLRARLAPELGPSRDDGKGAAVEKE
ncbi:MAG: hypothetical protein ACM3NW_04140 [Syntrophomonadaceae bacterium]